MSYVIEKNVSIPGKHNHLVETLKKMEVGDSVFIELYDGLKLNSLRTKIFNATQEIKRTTGFFFTVRSLVESDHNGIRVWRIK